MLIAMYNRYMTTYKCNIDDETFGKVSGVKRHQTRKHPGVQGLAIIEVQEDGSESIMEIEAKPVVKPAARRKAAAKPRAQAKPKAKAEAKPRGRTRKAPQEQKLVVEMPQAVEVVLTPENTVTINRGLFEKLMEIAGAPVK